ncbi:GDP-mannose-dependent alpha-(1-6)-phosphatidylinositol monomannoside mannosyltransferase [Rosistilla ulvae]|uniref:GDP-mannose-dependent alpha-(1-6)-phosphatidylinositol monomannoside mannosyltransferase n=1 Tax=Rosistilla ulvae TaxID=1930277 RepID=A0A517M0D1_9BACT|nr:GDP-mannose-dependent alpha-(1-6)-phosphatidylinositol monomannoside mannosyltransferase [Rosistilla ulvae]
MLHAARVLPEGWLAYLHSMRTGTPYHCYAHGEELNLQGSEDGGVMASRQHRWMARKVLCRAQGMIANSENTRRILTEQWNVPAGKITVLNPGVDTQTFCPSVRNLSVRYALGWNDAPVVLTVGRLQKRKGHDQMIRALPEILSAIPKLKYAIAGDGEERQALHALAAETGVSTSICWHPKVSDSSLLQMYQQCDLFALPNRQIGSDVEGFGMVLLEAAACGKATIAGRSGGTYEAIEDGVTGRLVDARSPHEIASATVQLLQDSTVKDSMGRAGRQRAKREFDWSVLANRV